MKKLKNKKIYLSILLVCVFIAMFSVVCFADYGYSVNVIYPDKTLFDVQDKFDYWTVHPTGGSGNYTEYDGLITVGSRQDKTKWDKITYYIEKQSDGYVYIHTLCLDSRGKVFDDNALSWIWCDYSYVFNEKEVKTQQDFWKTPLEKNTAFGYYGVSNAVVVSGTALIYLSYDKAYDYLVNGNLNLEDTFYVSDDYKCETPQKLDAYCSNDNMYDLTLVWQQYKDTTDMYSVVEVGWVYNFDLDYHMAPKYFDNGLPEVFKKNSQIINNNYDTSSTNKIKFDILNIVKRYALAKDSDNICFAFVVQNHSIDDVKKSDYAFIRVFVDKNGVSVYSSGSEDNSYNKQPIKNETDYSKDNGYSYTKDDFTSINSTSNEGFINSILSGFGLIGDNGLLSFLGGVFAYIPEWLWALIGAGVTFMVIIALFKLVVH